MVEHYSEIYNAIFKKESEHLWKIKPSVSQTVTLKQ
jgi:hypothetical protein